MFWRKTNSQEKILEALLTRSQSEVAFLRDQNQKLLDSIMVLTDKTAFRETKHAESSERAALLEMEKYKSMTPEQIMQQAEKEKKENEIVGMQMKLMAGG